jgi:hypothetical protein
MGHSAAILAQFFAAIDTATVCFDQSELQLCPGVREDEERELFNLNSGTLGEMGLGDEGDRHVPAVRRSKF